MINESAGNKSSCPDGWINACDCGASGSEFQTAGKIMAGSSEIAVENPGDFRVGQEVTVSACHVHHYGVVYDQAEPYVAKSLSPLRDEIEVRGLNASKSWQTFVIHFDKTAPVTFRWLAVDPAFQTLIHTRPFMDRHWCWQGESLPVGMDWVTLADGVQIRFKKTDWLPGQSISFHARNRLLARITGIRGKTMSLSERATCQASEAVVRHHDQAALQASLDRAIAERKGLFIPAGRYRLSKGLWIRNASVRVEGAHRDHVTLDISEDNTAVFWISGGREVVIRNLAMVGHTGFLELPSNQGFGTATGFVFWPTANQQMEVKGCAAVNFVGTERLLFEDLKVTRMASEAFYSHGTDRYGSPQAIQPPFEGRPELARQYTKSCIFHRCLVSDCGFNAFNNNDFAENTSILYCHVERVTNFCENASRFTRIIGNYALDGCSTCVHSGSTEDPRKVGSPQAVIADNVFEGGILGGGGIIIGKDASQVIVANNLFIGFSSGVSAIHIGGGRRIIVNGNHIDMTQIEKNPDDERCGITVEASNIIIADNHIYVRGARSEKVTGINVADHAVNVNIHDNLIENCHSGFRTGSRVYDDSLHAESEVAAVVGHEKDVRFEFRHTESEVTAVVGPRLFREQALPSWCGDSAPYRDWNLRWLTGSNAGKTTSIESYDKQAQTIAVKNEVPLQAGDRFAVYPRCANWQVHHNTIADCTNPMIMELLGKDGVHLDDNSISPELSSG